MRLLPFGAAVGIVLALVSAPAADPLPQHAVQVVDYQISVRLDEKAHQLAGRQRVSWRNPSTDTVGDLWFHLYLNAFKNSRTTFVTESGGQLRGDQLAPGKWGWIDVTSLKLADGRDLTGAMRFERPDDGNADDETVMRVVLPEPVAPGGEIVLDLAFKAQLPQVFARTGYYGDFHLVGQWFPKLGVYEPAGTRGRAAGGWNCHQFHANSEFYADFGHFLVDITVPKPFVVGATGERRSARENPDGTSTYVYEQADVHDFVWTADPTFVEVKRTFSASGDVTSAEYARVAQLLGRSTEDVRLNDVEITLLIHRHRLPQVDRHIDAAKAGLKWYGLWYGRYPYRTLTVVDPAPGGGGAGGMEYPTFITAGSSWLLNYWPLSGLRFVEMVTVHEFGHQFWYSLVANNEFEEAWLDEGLNTYSTGKVMDRVYGARSGMIDVPFLKAGDLDTVRMSNGPDMRFDTILQPAWTYSAGAYGFFSYQKPALVLHTLERWLGEQTMARIMRTYHERWRFRHPGSDDFFAVANEVSGRDLSGYFNQTIRGSGLLDYEIGSASTTLMRPPLGVFDVGGRRETRGSAARTAATRQKGAGQPMSYRSVVVVRRAGDVVMPVEIAFKFEGTPPERQAWDGSARWKRFEFTRPARLEWVSIDPDRRLVLDVDWINNDRRIEPDHRVGRKITATWMFFVQNLLAFVGL